MNSTTAAIHNDPDAPRVDLLKKLPYRKGQLKRSDIKKAVKAVVNARLAAERAAKAPR
jgi:hypothetical protein